ncbi:MAG: C-GCAxxG-C-C family protein [Bacteroidales bacterium]
MTVDERIEKAKNLFAQGYNCSQSVYMAFADKYGMTDQLAATISAPLGGGVGRMREVCGAVTGMALVAGLEIPVTDPKDKASKMSNYALVREMGSTFKEKHGSIVCRELLGLDTGKEPELTPTGHPVVKPGKHSCAEMVETAVRIIAERLGE